MAMVKISAVDTKFQIQLSTYEVSGSKFSEEKNILAYLNKPSILLSIVIKRNALE